MTSNLEDGVSEKDCKFIYDYASSLSSFDCSYEGKDYRIWTQFADAPILHINVTTVNGRTINIVDYGSNGLSRNDMVTIEDKQCTFEDLSAYEQDLAKEIYLQAIRVAKLQIRKKVDERTRCLEEFLDPAQNG